MQRKAVNVYVQLSRNHIRLTTTFILRCALDEETRFSFENHRDEHDEFAFKDLFVFQRVGAIFWKAQQPRMSNYWSGEGLLAVNQVQGFICCPM